jgi:predicted MFS family arabinose efflux permease
VTALVGGAVLLVGFALLERRAAHPMLPGRVLADRDRAASYAVMFLAPASMFSMFFFLTLVLQNVMGESPLTTGLMFLPFSGVMILAAVVVSRLVQRVDPGRLAGIGAAIAGIAVLGMSRIPYGDDPAALSADVSYAADVLPWVVLMPLGMAMIFIPTTMSVVHGVGARDSGIASGVLNTMQQVGGAPGLALPGTLAFDAADGKAAQICRALAAEGGRCSPAGALADVSFLHGATTAFMWGSGMMFLAAIIAVAFNRIRHEDLGGAAPDAAVAAP